MGHVNTSEVEEGLVDLELYKNGALHQYGDRQVVWNNDGGGEAWDVTGPTPDDIEGAGRLLQTIGSMNGTTDYLEIYAFSQGLAWTITGGQANTYFQAALLQVAS